MTPLYQPTDFKRYYERRRHRDRDRRMLNSLPLAHRLSSRCADGVFEEEYLLGQAIVGLVEAADNFDELEPNCRFGAFARPYIVAALERNCDAEEVDAAQAEIAAAISSQDRVQELASFLDVPVDALVGGLMDATAHEPLSSPRRPLRGVA